MIKHTSFSAPKPPEFCRYSPHSGRVFALKGEVCYRQLCVCSLLKGKSVTDNYVNALCLKGKSVTDSNVYGLCLKGKSVTDSYVLSLSLKEKSVNQPIVLFKVTGRGQEKHLRLCI